MNNNKCELMKALESQVSNMSHQIKSLKDSVTTDFECLRKDNDELAMRIINLERQVRSNNLVIYGLQENNETNVRQSVIQFFNSMLGLPISESGVEAAYRLGRGVDGRIRPILVKTSHHVKAAVFSSCYKLKNSRISVSDDLSKEDRVMKNKLMPYLKTAKARNLKTFIKYDRLIVNNKSWSLEELNSSGFLDKTVSSVPAQSSAADSEFSLPSAPPAVLSSSLTSTIIDQSRGLQGARSAAVAVPLVPSNHNNNINNEISTGAVPKQVPHRPVTRRAAQNTFL